MTKRLLTLLTALALTMAMAGPAWCAGEVSLKARPGLAGIFKVNQPVLIRVDIDNPGEKISGKITVAPADRENPARRFGPLYTSEVEVPAGGLITRDLLVPGDLASSTPLVRLEAGGAILAEARLEGAALGGGLFILPLNEKMMGSGLFTWLDKNQSSQVAVKYLPPEELPEKSLFLGPCDVIALDRGAAARLNPAQAGAVREWVRLGGTLILSGEAAAAANAQLAGTGPALSPGDPVARKRLGRGEVILTRAPLEEIKDPGGKTWEAMGLISGDSRLDEEKYNLQHVLADAGSYLPMVNMPGVPAIIAIWVVYTLAVGPGIYLLLKRLNRRELAWGLVPAAAILTALAFYAISPVNRMQAYLAHTTASLEIIDRDLAEIRAAGTFVLPRGGSLEVSGSNNARLNPVNAYYGRRGPATVTVFAGEAGSRVVFDEVEYGSMRQVYSYGLVHGLGAISGRIYFREDRVMGEITNGTPFDLRDCRLLVGRSLLEIGSLPAGGSKQLNEPLNLGQIVNGPGEVYPPGPQPAAKVRETRLISGSMAYRQGAGEIYFLGWSESSQPPEQFKVVRPQGQGQSAALTLVRQKMDLDIPPGPFRLPAEFIKNSVRGLSGGYGTGPNGWLMVHRGEVQVTYDLPDTLKNAGFQLTAIEVPPADQAPYKVEILRRDTALWEEVDRRGQRYSGPEALNYLSADGKIDLKISSPTEKTETGFRGIAVEGVMGQ